MDAHTDPRTGSRPVPVETSTMLIAQSRLAAGEIRVAAEAIARAEGGGEVAVLARRLAQHATRLGQVANALSAVPVDRIAVLYLPAEVPFGRRLSAACTAWWLILRGRSTRSS